MSVDIDGDVLLVVDAGVWVVDAGVWVVDAEENETVVVGFFGLIGIDSVDLVDDVELSDHAVSGQVGYTIVVGPPGKVNPIVVRER